MIKKDIQGFYDETGNLVGVFLSARLWQEIGSKINPILEEALLQLKGEKSLQEKTFEVEEVLEPMEDWEKFLAFWDFRYPVEKKVLCKHCGQETEDWTVDSPRKFILKAANLGGLVAFQCQQCKARVLKRHFKDHITYEVKPFIQKG